MGRKSKADQRRTQIIEACFQCVTQDGAAGASVRKIAARAGVQPSVLHHYFESRDQIMEQAVVHFTDRIFEDFQEQLTTTGADSPDAGMAFIFSKGMINEDYTGFFLECCVAARQNLRIRDTLALLFARFRTAIQEQLGQIPGFGALPESKKHLLASLIVALHEGTELQWFADPKAVALDQALAATRQIIALFLDSGAETPGKG